MTSSRQLIIDQYRQRIAASERTRLTKADLAELIAEFIDRLAITKTKAKIKEICAAEITLLEEGYPQATIGKVYLPMYRKAIQSSADDGLLPLTKSTSREYIYSKRHSDETGKAVDHLALDYLKYNSATYSQFASISAERNNLKQDNLQPVNPDTFLAAAANLLTSADPFDLAVGIAATTGRRFSEVVAKGRMTATNDLYWISFGGQLKKRTYGKLAEADSYLTPCLLPAAVVLNALERFRQHPRIAALADFSTIEINRSLADSVKRSVVRNFGDTGIVPVLPSESAVTVHNLRGIYGEICTHFFCPPDRAVSRFVQERLGHVISADELKRANSSATQHYFHYYLVDSNGQHLGAKGIKLGEATPIKIIADNYKNFNSMPVQLELLDAQNMPMQLTQELAIAHGHIAELEQKLAALYQDNQGYQQTIEQLRNILQPTRARSRTKAPPKISVPPKAAPEPPTVKLPKSEQKRRRPATAKILAAIETIMLWNHQNDQKFAISQTLLLKVTGCNMPAIKRIVEEYAEMIDHHHVQYDIQPRHQSKKLDIIISFMKQQS